MLNAADHQFSSRSWPPIPARKRNCYLLPATLVSCGCTKELPLQKRNTHFFEEMSCFGGDVPDDEREAMKQRKRQQKEINAQLKQDKIAYKATHRLLLLGKHTYFDDAGGFVECLGVA